MHLKIVHPPRTTREDPRRASAAARRRRSRCLSTRPWDAPAGPGLARRGARACLSVPPAPLSPEGSCDMTASRGAVAVMRCAATCKQAIWLPRSCQRGAPARRSLHARQQRSHPAAARYKWSSGAGASERAALNRGGGRRRDGEGRGRVPESQAPRRRQQHRTPGGESRPRPALSHAAQPGRENGSPPAAGAAAAAAGRLALLGRAAARAPRCLARLPLWGRCQLAGLRCSTALQNSSTLSALPSVSMQFWNCAAPCVCVCV